MRSESFWRWHDWFWRVYDWAARLGIPGFLTSLVGGTVIGALFRYDNWDPPVVLLAAIIAFAAFASIYVAACRFWDRREGSAKSPTSAVAPPSVQQSPLIEEIANLRLADDPATLSLFDGAEADRFIPLVEGDKLTAWARPMGRGQPPLTEISGAQWKSLYLLFAPKTGEGMINQTFLKTKLGNDTFYYDVYFNRSQIERVWPLISDLWKPIYIAVKYISDKKGDPDTTKGVVSALSELRQAAYDGAVRVRGRKQLFQARPFGGDDFDTISTDIDREYWVVSQMAPIASAAEAQTMSHTLPLTAYAWGPKGVYERKQYAQLLVNWPDILRNWPDNANDGRRKIALQLDDLYALGVGERNRLMPKMPNFDRNEEEGNLNDWNDKVLSLLDADFITVSEKSSFRTLNIFEATSTTFPGKSPEQHHLEAIWTEKLRRLQSIIDRIGQ